MAVVAHISIFRFWSVCPGNGGHLTSPGPSFQFKQMKVHFRSALVRIAVHP